MVLPYDNWGSSWTEAIDVWVTDSLNVIVGNSSFNPTIPETGYALHDLTFNGTTNISDVIVLLRIQAGTSTVSSDIVNNTLAKHGYNALRNGRYYNPQVAAQQYYLGFENIASPNQRTLNSPDPSTVHGGTAMSMNMIRKEFKLPDLADTAGSKISEFQGEDAGIPASGETSFRDFYGATGGVIAVWSYNITEADKERNGYVTVSLANAKAQFEGNPFSFQFAGADKTYRIYIGYQNGATGTSWRGDFQIDDIALQEIDNTIITRWSFESTGEGWQQLGSFGENYDASTPNDDIFDVIQDTNWQTVNTGTAARNWNRDASGTPSSGTGVSFADRGSWYLYTETSAPATYQTNFWLRSPTIELPNGNWSQLTWAWACYSSVQAGQDNQGKYTVYVVAEPPSLDKQPMDPQISTGTSLNSTNVRRSRWPIGWTYPSGSYHVGTGPTGIYNYGRVPEQSEFMIYLRYKNGTAGTSYRGDFQVTQVDLLDGTGSPQRSYGFGSIWSGAPWYTININTQGRDIERWEDTIGKWSLMADGFNTTQYQWNKNSGGTPSSSTGIDPNTDDEPYIYVETSGTSGITSGAYYWARSRVMSVPTGTQRGQGISTMDIWYFAYGDNIEIDALDVWVDHDNSYRQDPDWSFL